MKNSILTAVVVIITTISAFSQSITETRHIKSTAFQIYENYKVVMSGLYSRSSYTEDNFMALFDDKAVLYNDIIPANTPEQLSPSEYFEKFKANINRIYPVFSDFKMGDPVSAGNKWQIQCCFTRTTRFRTQKDMKYPEWPFNYTMTIEMDQSYNDTNKVCENAKIVSVEVDHPLEKFFIIENKENIPLTTKSGEPLNDWDEEYQSRIFPNDKWKISDISVFESIIHDHIFEYSKGKLSKNKMDARFYQTEIHQFKKNIFGIGVNYCPIAWGNQINNEHANNYNVMTKYTPNTWSLSFFYGKQVFHKDKLTGFVNFGLDLNNYEYEYSCTFDTQNSQANPESLIENISIVSASVPLSVQFLRQLSQQTKKQFYLSFELGVFVECTFSASSELDNDNCERSLLIPSFDCGIFGSVGLWYALNGNNLLKFNVSYKHSNYSHLDYKGDSVIPSGNNKKSFLHETNQGLRNIYFGISWVRPIKGKSKYY